MSSKLLIQFQNINGKIVTRITIVYLIDVRFYKKCRMNVYLAGARREIFSSLIGSSGSRADTGLTDWRTNVKLLLSR